jgi:hypothetical protein
MKTLLQSIAVLAVIVGAVFGLTFLTQNTRTPVENPTDPVATKGAISGSPLRIAEKTAVWDEDDPQYAAEFERGSRGHYDFWVSNPHPVPVNVALMTSSCVCTEVQVGIVPTEELASWKKRNEDLAGVNIALGLIGAPNLCGALADNGLGGKVQWTTLHRRDRDSTSPGFNVPAADTQSGPQMALLRINWDGKDPNAMRLTADLQHRIGTQAEFTRFEVRTMIVPPAMISSAVLNFGELNFNERRQIMLYCWSASRDQFSLTIEDLSHDPCIDAGPPRLLAPDERTAVAQTLRATGQVPPTKIRSGYAVPIVIYERRGNAQLDLGPFSRKLYLKTDAIPEPSIVTLQGMVRGTIDIGQGADLDRVNLGAFRADRPHDTTVMVTAKEANAQLRFRDVKPSYLKVTLTETAGAVGYKQWKLHVDVEANTVSGILPPDSAIYLETVTNPPRAIRIPVIGNGTVR